MDARHSVRDSIRAFIIANFLFDNGDVADDASLMGEGIVDSTGVLELVMFVEEDLGVVVADDEVLPANFDSIDNLVAYVQRKKEAGATLIHEGILSVT